MTIRLLILLSLCFFSMASQQAAEPEELPLVYLPFQDVEGNPSLENAGTLSFTASFVHSKEASTSVFNFSDEASPAYPDGKSVSSVDRFRENRGKIVLGDPENPGKLESLDEMDVMTLSGWLKLEEDAEGVQPIFSHATGNHGWWFMYDPSQEAFAIRFASSTVHFEGSNVTPGEWVFFAVVFNAELSPDERLVLHLSREDLGIISFGRSGIFTSTLGTNSSNATVIGGEGSPFANEFLQGWLDDIRVYKSDLSYSLEQLMTVDRDQLTAAVPVPPAPEVRPLLQPLPEKGPDGLVYPDFRYAGVPGGIPDVAVVADLSEFGGSAGSDIADALEKGVEHIHSLGGGALFIGPGEYFLDRPILVPYDNIVIRGAGKDETKILFRWEPEPHSIEFVGLEDGDEIPRNKEIGVGAWNASKDNTVVSLKSLRLEINGQLADEQTDGEGPWFFLSPDNRRTRDMLKRGKNTLRAEVTYADGKMVEKTIEVEVPANESGLMATSPSAVAIRFAEASGGSQVDFGPQYDPAMPIERGTITIPIYLKGWEPGDLIQIMDETNNRWFGHPIMVIHSITETETTFTQPLRRDVLAKQFRKLPSIRNSGIEDITIEQTSEHWTGLVSFNRDYACWARGVRLVNAGRNPISGPRKNGEFRDLEIDGSRFHFGVGGGTGYFGFSQAEDCLAENIVTRKLRHAPNFQLGTMGCVIRNSRFYDSDMHFHANPNWENLLETSVIRSVGTNRSYGSYGCGVYMAGRPANAGQGDRNVIYNCDISSYDEYGNRSSVAFNGGGGAGWIFAHNRFTHDYGNAISFHEDPLEVIFQNNVFVNMIPRSPAVKGNISKVHLKDNQFLSYGQEELAETPPATETGTVFGEVGGEPYEGTPTEKLARFTRFLEEIDAVAPAPTAPVRSIYEWQMSQ